MIHYIKSKGDLRYRLIAYTSPYYINYYNYYVTTGFQFAGTSIDVIIPLIPSISMIKTPSINRSIAGIVKGNNRRPIALMYIQILKKPVYF